MKFPPFPNEGEKPSTSQSMELAYQSAENCNRTLQHTPSSECPEPPHLHQHHASEEQQRYGSDRPNTNDPADTDLQFVGDEKDQCAMQGSGDASMSNQELPSMPATSDAGSTKAMETEMPPYRQTTSVQSATDRTTLSAELAFSDAQDSTHASQPDIPKDQPTDRNQCFAREEEKATDNPDQKGASNIKPSSPRSSNKNSRPPQPSQQQMPVPTTDHDTGIRPLVALDTSVSPCPENPAHNMVATPNDGEGQGECSQHALIEDDASSAVSLCVENIDGPPTENALPRPSSSSASNSESTPPATLPSPG